MIVPSNFLDEGYWFLNPWSWQFLFVIGLVAMTHVLSGAVTILPPSCCFVALSAFYVGLSFLWVTLSWWNIDLLLRLAGGAHRFRQDVPVD